MPATETSMQDIMKLKPYLLDKKWRMDNLYHVLDKSGKTVKYAHNAMQKIRARTWWPRKLDLKTRQQGSSLYYTLDSFDDMMFMPNQTIGIVAHKNKSARDLIEKAIFAHEHLPVEIRDANPIIEKNKGGIKLANGSSIWAATSFRSGTLQRLICLSADTYVFTKNGILKNITEISSGDLVLTDRGSYGKVAGVTKTPSELADEKMYAVKVYGYYEPLKLTENHLVLCRDNASDYTGRLKGNGTPIWKKAKELTKDDYIAFPIREWSNKLRTGTLPCGDKKTRIKVDYDLGYLFGFYLAEGGCRKAEVSFSIHQREIDSVVALIEKYKAYYNSYRVYRVKTSKTAIVTINGEKFSSFICEHLGTGDEKNIPDAVWNYGRQFLDGLLKGYFDGDGYYGNTSYVTVTSTRRQLIDQVKFLLISLRYGVPSIYNQKAGERYGRNCKEVWVLKIQGPANWKFRKHYGLELPEYTTWAANWRIDHGRAPEAHKAWRRGKDHYWAQVRDIQEIPQEEFVYDIVMDNEPHNFVTAQGVVHNCSEYGYICKKMPDRAIEIKSGALNSVSPDCEIIFESTSLGKGGDWEKMIMDAKRRMESGQKITKMDYVAIFIPWMLDTTCRLDPDGVPIYPRYQEYFDKLKSMGINLDPWQRAWYCKKEEEQGAAMKLEYPSYLDEAFEAVLEGAYFQEQMTQLRLNHRITSVPYQPGVLVNCSWDLGVNDETAIWFTQRVGREYRIIDYYANKDVGLDHYHNVLMGKGYKYGVHYVPHDIRVREIGNAGLSRLESFEKLFGRGSAAICPSIPIADGIEAVRKFLPMCWFDEEKCDEGIDGLDGYTKVWDAKLGSYRDAPLHNSCSNPADSFRYLAICSRLEEQHQTRSQARAASRSGSKPKKNWRDAYC